MTKKRDKSVGTSNVGRLALSRNATRPKDASVTLKRTKPKYKVNVSRTILLTRGEQQT